MIAPPKKNFEVLCSFRNRAMSYAFEICAPSSKRSIVMKRLVLSVVFLGLVQTSGAATWQVRWERKVWPSWGNPDQRMEVLIYANDLGKPSTEIVMLGIEDKKGRLAGVMGGSGRMWFWQNHQMMSCNMCDSSEVIWGVDAPACVQAINRTLAPQAQRIETDGETIRRWSRGFWCWLRRKPLPKPPPDKTLGTMIVPSWPTE